jgi:hypothetical protein
MRKFEVQINLFISMLMLAASMLPALHAMEHFDSDFEPIPENSETDHSFSENSVDCELCDFQFSSSNAPELFEYSLNAPKVQDIIQISPERDIHQIFSSYFSLRAPPAVLA